MAAGWPPEPGPAHAGHPPRVPYTATVTHPPAALPGRRPTAGPEREHVATIDVILAGLYAAIFLGTTVALLGRKALELPWLSDQGDLGLAIDLRVELLSRASIILVLACAVALAWRRSRPALSFLAICGIGCVQVLLGEPVALWNVAMPISLFSVAAYGSRTAGRFALGAAVAGYVAIWVVQERVLGRLGDLPDPLSVLATPRGAAFVAMFALLVVIWAFGDQVRGTHERLAFERERAEQREREHAADARFGALAERQRIARELHDVVAHGLSVIIVQADGALYAEAQHPEAPRQALETIASTGRESLTEMRRLLGVLRDDPDAPGMAPQPDLAAVPALIDGFRDAGLTIDHEVEGVVRPVPPAVGLTAFRVLQESLTNVLHHAGATRVVVRVAFRPEALAILVANEPGQRRNPQARTDRQGLGLVGMRERVGLLGGRMVAGPTPDEGFRVEVEIPARPDLRDPRTATAWSPATAAGLDAVGRREGAG